MLKAGAKGIVREDGRHERKGETWREIEEAAHGLQASKSELAKANS